MRLSPGREFPSEGFIPALFEGAGFDYLKDLNFPGEYPYTRGIEPLMYRENLWLMGAVRRIRFGGRDEPEIQVPAGTGNYSLYSGLGSSDPDGL